MTDAPPPPPQQPDNGQPQQPYNAQPQQPYNAQPQQPYTAPPQPLNPQEEKLWATLTHVGGIFFGFIPALVVYLVMKDRGPFIRAHSASALNFQLTALIAALVSGLLSIIGIGIVLLFAVQIVVVVFSIIAAVKANQGQWYRYPVAIKFVQE